MSMNNYNGTIGNRTRDLSACSAVPQPTAPPRGPAADCFLSSHLRGLGVAAVRPDRISPSMGVMCRGISASSQFSDESPKACVLLIFGDLLPVNG